MELNFLQIRTGNNVYKITHIYIYTMELNLLQIWTGNMYIIYMDLHMIKEGLYIYIYIYIYVISCLYLLQI
jgi:hypothetical protein